MKQQLSLPKNKKARTQLITVLMNAVPGTWTLNHTARTMKSISARLAGVTLLMNVLHQTPQFPVKTLTFLIHTVSVEILLMELTANLKLVLIPITEP